MSSKCYIVMLIVFCLPQCTLWCVLQPAVVVDLNTANVHDQDIQCFSVADVQALNTASSDHAVRLSEDTVQLPPSRMIFAVHEPKPVKSSQLTTNRNTAVSPDAVKGSKTLKPPNKRQSSSGRFYEPRRKRLRQDQQSQHGTSAIVWTESLFVSEASDVGGDAGKVMSAVDAKQLASVPLSAVTFGPLVTDAGQSQTTSFPEQKSADFTQLPLNVTAAVDSNSARGAAAGQKLIQRVGVGTGANVEDGRRSSNVSSGSAIAHISKSCTSSAVEDAHLLKSPFTVQRSVVAGSRGRSRSTSVPVVRTTLLTSFSPRSAPSSTTNTKFLVPIHTKSGNLSSRPVYRVHPASDTRKLLTGTDEQPNVGIRPACISTAARQSFSSATALSVVSRVHAESSSFSQSKLSVDPASPPMPTVTIRVRPSVTVSGPRHYSASVQQQHTSLPTAGNSGPQCTSSTNLVRAVLSQPITARSSVPSNTPTTNQMTLRASSSQPVRIRINAADLGNPSDPRAVMNHVRGILSRTNTILPGAQICIRYMPPATTAATSLLASQCGHPAQTTHVSKPMDPRVSQLDGTADSDSESASETETVKWNGDNTSPSSTGVDSAVYSRRRSKAFADADEKPASDSRVRC